jgi:hypothetical protein
MGREKITKIDKLLVTNSSALVEQLTNDLKVVGSNPVENRAKGESVRLCFRSDIDKFLTDVNFTSACLIYAPSQVALAAVIHAASKQGHNLVPNP